MKTAAFSSINEDVHHDNDQCQAGKKVFGNVRVNGTGRKPLCEECKQLDAAGK
jgi:hypothetical protein